jgi:hypothetical protein
MVINKITEDLSYCMEEKNSFYSKSEGQFLLLAEN